MKQSILVALFGSVLILIASAALAAGPPPEVQEAVKKKAQANVPPEEVAQAAGRSSGCPAVKKRSPISSLTPDQQDILKTLSQKFNTEAQPLRMAMWTKHEEFKKLSAEKKLDKGKMNELITDMQSIQKKLDNVRNEYLAEIRKAGIPVPMGPLNDCPAVSRTSTKSGNGGYAKFGGSGPRGIARGYRLGAKGAYTDGGSGRSGCAGCQAQ